MSQSTPTTAPQAAPPARPAQESAAAGPGGYYRKTRYLLAIGLIAYGIWNFHDGFYKYPAENADSRREGFQKMPHSNMDLGFNRALAFICPAGGLALLAWALFNSRGQYRLKDQTLHVPGHPPVALDQIEALDKSRWDRKGIAYVTYRRGNGKEAVFKLDDFVYEREGIDLIYQWIEWSLLQPQAPRAAAAPPPPPPPIQRS